MSCLALCRENSCTTGSAKTQWAPQGAVAQRGSSVFGKARRVSALGPCWQEATGINQPSQEKNERSARGLVLLSSLLRRRSINQNTMAFVFFLLHYVAISV